MTREALASALEMLPVNDPDWRWDLPLTDIVAAARKQLALMAEKCGTCEGVGHYIVQSTRAQWEIDDIPCPTCRGSGNAYKQETVEAIAKVIQDYFPFTGQRKLNVEFAIAVLDAINGLDQEAPK